MYVKIGEWKRANLVGNFSYMGERYVHPPTRMRRHSKQHGGERQATVNEVPQLLKHSEAKERIAQWVSGMLFCDINET